MSENCPLGAAYYDDGEMCIGCGVCFAESLEEIDEAHRKLNEYLKMSPEEREEFMREDAYFKEK